MRGCAWGSIQSSLAFGPFDQRAHLKDGDVAPQRAEQFVLAPDLMITNCQYGVSPFERRIAEVDSAIRRNHVEDGPSFTRRGNLRLGPLTIPMLTLSGETAEAAAKGEAQLAEPCSPDKAMDVIDDQIDLLLDITAHSYRSATSSRPRCSTSR